MLLFLKSVYHNSTHGPGKDQIPPCRETEGRETMKDSGDGWSKELQGSRMYKETSYLLKAVAQAVTQLAQKLLQSLL